MTAGQEERMPVQLERDAQGRLCCRPTEGGEPVPVTVIRAFPLSAPGHGLSLVGPDGRERAWIDRLDALAQPARAWVDEALRLRDFAPTLTRLVEVSSFSTPSTWTVDTDRGRTRFVLKGEEDIRRLDAGALLITTADGVSLRVADRFKLDRHSRRLLDRFLA